MKMKKMVTKSVVGLSLLGAGVVATIAVVPSENVVYAEAPTLVDVEEGLDWSVLDSALSRYDGLSQKRKDYVNQRFIGTGLSTLETMTNHYAGEQFREDINQQEFINEDAVILNNFIDLAIQDDTPFQDIASCSTEAKSAIAWLLENGITTGYNATTFAPRNTLTRAEMVTFLYRLAGKPDVAINDFPDTTGLSQAFRQAISWAKAAGITTGYNATTFAPNQPVLREQMASFFYRLAGKPVGRFSYSFEDVSTESTHSQAIGWLSQTGITSGYSSSAYGPRDAVTREQMALFLKRYADKVGMSEESKEAEVPAEPNNPNSPVIDAGADHTINAGDSITMGTTGKWRILKVDGTKYLIIKEEALTETEAGFSGLGSSYQRGTAWLDSGNLQVPFLSSTAVSKSGVDDSQGLSAGSIIESRGFYYFDSDGSNGYEDSGATSYKDNNDPKYKYGLKGAIDYYYNNSIAPSYSEYVLPVELHNPDLNIFKATNDLEWSYNSGTWYGVYVEDTDFATTLSGSTKQAFALSCGDINASIGMGLNPDGKNGVECSDLFDFGDDWFWLRSASGCYDTACAVYEGGYFSGNIGVWCSLPVRPALWISIND